MIFDSLIDNIRLSEGFSPIIERNLQGALASSSSSGHMAGLGVYAPPLTEQFEATYQTIAAVYTAVSVIANNGSAQPNKIVETDDEGNILRDISKDPEFKLLIEKPNPWQSTKQFIFATLTYLGLTGEAPWIFGFDTEFGEYMYPVDPSRLKVYGSKTKLISHYGLVFRGSGEEIRISKENVLFIKYFHPNNPLRGLSPISSAREDLILDRQVVATSHNILKRGATPSGIISTKQAIPKVAFDRYNEFIRKEHEGSNNAGKLLLLDRGFNYQQMGFTQKDLQAIETRKFTEKMVGKVYHLPPIAMGDFSDASILQNTVVQKELMWTGGIIPVLSLVSDIVSQFLLPRFTDRDTTNIKWIFDLSNVDAIKENKNDLSKRYLQGARVGATTPNDYRMHVLELPPIDTPEMNQTYITGAMAPLSEASTPETNGFKNGEVPASYRIEEIVSKAKEFLSFDQRFKQLASGVERSMDTIKGTHVRNEIQKGIQALNRIRGEWINDFEPDIISVFSNMNKAIVSSLLSQKDYKISVLKVNIDWDKFERDFIDIGAPIILGAADAAAEELLAISLLDDINTLTFVAERAEFYADSVINTSQKAVNKIIADGIAEGKTINEIAAFLTTHLTEATISRANLIARTEVINATNAGRFLSMKKDPDINGKAWGTQRDNKVRDEHAILDGEIQKLDESFSNGLDYPGEPNCRCYVIPVKIEDKPTEA